MMLQLVDEKKHGWKLILIERMINQLDIIKIPYMIPLVLMMVMLRSDE